MAMQRIQSAWNSYLDAYRGLSSGIWLLAIVMFINQMGTMILPFLSMYMTNRLGLTMQQAGIVLSCYGLGTMSGSWLGGYLTDKFGSYRVQLMSMFGVVPLYIALPQIQTFLALCAFVYLVSLTKDTFRPANSAAISHYARPENLTRAFSLNRMAINLGFSIGPALGGFLIMYDFNALFYTSASICALSAVIFWYFFRHRHQHVERKKSDQHLVKPTARNAYFDRQFLLFSGCIALYATCFFQLLNALPLYYKTEAKLDAQHVGLLMAFNGLVVFVFEMIVVHWAERKLSLRQNMIVGTALCAVSFAVLLPGSAHLILYLSMFLMSLSEILIMPFSATIAVERSTAANRGSYMGLNGMSYSIAFASSPLVGMALAEAFGFTSLWIFDTITLLVVAIAFYWIVPLLVQPKKTN